MRWKPANLSVILTKSAGEKLLLDAEYYSSSYDLELKGSCILYNKKIWTVSGFKVSKKDGLPESIFVKMPGFFGELEIGPSEFDNIDYAPCHSLGGTRRKAHSRKQSARKNRRTRRH